MTIVAFGVANRTAHADPLSASGATQPSAPTLTGWRKLELTFPFLKPLRFSFKADSVPGFEMLRLETFRAESVWWERGPLSIQSFTEVAPALELDCTVTCQPTLARTVGVEGHLALGSIGRAIPETNIFLRGQSSQVIPAVPGSVMPARSFKLLGAGFSGLLDF